MIQVATQKMHRHGADGNRFFWDVNVKGEGKGVYRSRHITAEGVTKEFALNGKKILSVKPARQ